MNVVLVFPDPEKPAVVRHVLFFFPPQKTLKASRSQSFEHIVRDFLFVKQTAGHLASWERRQEECITIKMYYHCVNAT